MRRATEPYKIVEKRENTIEIDEDGVLNKVLIDHVSPVTRRGDRTTKVYQEDDPSAENAYQDMDMTIWQTTKNI